MKLAAFLLLAGVLAAQSPAPDISGVWRPGRARGADAPPAATPLLLKPAYKEAYDERRKLEREAQARGEQLLAPGTSLCTPYGVPTMMSVVSYPVEIVQMPKQVTIISEAFSEARRIYIGKPQLPIDEVPPGYYGRSVGHWDGDTLVVDTVGIAPTVKGYQGMPHSEKMRVTERIRRVTPDSLHDQVTIDDPEVLEKPVTFTYTYNLAPDYEMVEFVCDNNREYVDEKGVVHMRLEQ